MPKGFDFGISADGELIVDKETHDIETVTEDILLLQLSYNRAKSVARDWFIDHIGADLEELIGMPCNESTAEYGKDKIIDVLIFDDLWERQDIFIKATIESNITILYDIYLKVYNDDRTETISYEIGIELDLIKGVKIRYGWRPRRGRDRKW